jgi:P4 family phage/plasmid primase-like protien
MKKSLVSEKKNISINNIYNMEENKEILKWYQQMKFVVGSGSMSFNDKTQKKTPPKWDLKEGTKKFSWQNDDDRLCLENKNFYYILTGAKSNITVIDIDDATKPENKKLIELMKDCKTIATTTKDHYHYYYKYNSDIKNVSSKKDKNGDSIYYLDTRNDGGIIYAPPTTYRKDNKTVRVNYSFLKKDNELQDVPKEVLDYLRTLSNGWYFKNQSMFIDSEEEEEIKNNTPKNDSISETNTEPKEVDTKYTKLLDILNIERWNTYDDWINIGMALKHINKDFFDIYNEYSKKAPKYKCIEEVQKMWNGFNQDLTKRIFTIKFIERLAKEDNIDKYNKWFEEYNEFKFDETNFFENLDQMSQSDWAKIYYSKNKDKYIVSKNKEWYEYNDYNILINQKGIPSSLLNSITDTLQEYIIKKRNQTTPTSIKNYDSVMKNIKKFYINLGSSNYVKCIINYLENLYINVDLDDLIDNNMNVLAFNNKLYDIELKVFRNINPDDYITKTTKTNAPENSNKEIKNKINQILLDIFNSQEQVDYWLKITGLSLFSNKYQSMYILTGRGGNGKGFLNNILEKCLGDYYYMASNTFLTEQIKDGKPNSTLANAKGRRYLSISEPNDNSMDSAFNVSFIKMITGNDTITTRDLNKSNISYKPQFTPFILCNDKPKVDKIDGGFERRVKIHPYPNQFCENPTKKNEKKIDINLSNCINKDFLDNFMTILIDVAVENIAKGSIEQTKENINQTKEYLYENNPVKNYIDQCLVKVNGKRIKFADLYTSYINKGFENITKTKFKSELIRNDLKVEKKSDIYVFDIEYKQEEEE